MTAKRKAKPIAKRPQLALPPPTSKEVKAIADAAIRLSKRRQRVQVTVKVADGVGTLGQPHSDGQGWSAQVNNAFGTSVLRTTSASVIFHPLQPVKSRMPTTTSERIKPTGRMAALPCSKRPDQL